MFTLVLSYISGYFRSIDPVLKRGHFIIMDWT